jgi:hypothetical protein
MPTDLKTLEVLGLRDIPLWYREKYKLPSLSPFNHDLQPLTGDGNRFSAASNVARSPDRPGAEATAYVAPMSGFQGFIDLPGDSLPTYPPLDPIRRAISLTHGQDRVLIQESSITGRGNHGGSAKISDLTSPGSKDRSESTSPRRVHTRRPHLRFSRLPSISESPSFPGSVPRDLIDTIAII